MKNITYSRPTLKNNIEVALSSDKITSKLESHSLELTYRLDNKTAFIDLEKSNPDLLLASLEALFTNSDTEKVNLKYNGSLRIDLDSMKNSDVLELTYTEFFQLPNIWTSNPSYIQRPITWSQTNDVVHPTRPIVNEGQILYTRLIPSTGRVLTFRCIDIEKDLDIFHEWHNQPRVAKFWELAQTKEELRAYLQKGLADRHQIPTIVEFDGKQIGYFEFYWIKEDRLGPYYESGMFDRGFHLLIGELSVMGFENTDSILKSTCHYIYLDEIKTQKICAEPRVDNSNIIKYVATFKAWRKVKEFDFPHKRAALLECTRDKFFMGRYL